MMASRRQGQAEIFGLVLIVLFIAIGFLLFIRFTLNSDQGQSLKAVYDGKQTGQTFVNSLTKVELDCGNGKVASIRDLLIDLASGKEHTCDGSHADTGTHLNETIRTILDGTLTKLGHNYRLQISSLLGNTETELYDGLGPFQNEEIPETERCGGRMQREANQVILPLTTGGSIVIRLDRCAG